MCPLSLAVLEVVVVTLNGEIFALALSASEAALFAVSLTLSKPLRLNVPSVSAKALPVAVEPLTKPAASLVAVLTPI